MRKLTSGECELLIADPDSLTSGEGLQILDVVDEIVSFVWSRKCNAPDEFELQVKSTADNVRLFTKDRLLIINDYKDVNWEYHPPTSRSIYLATKKSEFVNNYDFDFSPYRSLTFTGGNTQNGNYWVENGDMATVEAPFEDKTFTIKSDGGRYNQGEYSISATGITETRDYYNHCGIARIEGELLNPPPSQYGSYKYTDYVGIIESIDCKSANRNDEDYSLILTIKGRSLESIFERRIVWDYNELIYFDGTDTTWGDDPVSSNPDKFMLMMENIYNFMADDIIAPPMVKKEGDKKPSAVDFQNRGIWNIIMGHYGQSILLGNPYIEKAIEAEDYISRFFTENMAYVSDYEGTDLLTVLKNVCDSYGLNMRSYLLIDVPGSYIDIDVNIGVQVLGLGRMRPMFSATYNATLDGRNLDVDSLNKVCFIVVELSIPENKSFIDNTGNDFVIFSQNVDNLKDVQFSKSYSQIRNIAEIKGEDQGKNTVYATQFNSEEEPTGWTRKEIFVDASDITMEKKGKKYREDTYIPALKQAGKNALTEHSRNRNYVFDGTTIIGLENDTYKYGEDYDIGCLVQFYDEIYDESIQVKITEIIESIDTTDGYKMSASFDRVVLDFNPDDPLKYYYYTIDDKEKVITITGIKLEALMEDDVDYLGVIEFTDKVYSAVKGKKIKKKINNQIVKEYYIDNPDEEETMKLGNRFGTSGVSTNTDLNKNMIDVFGITPKYKDYSIKLDLKYSI